MGVLVNYTGVAEVLMNARFYALNVSVAFGLDMYSEDNGSALRKAYPATIIEKYLGWSKGGSCKY